MSGRDARSATSAGQGGFPQRLGTVLASRKGKVLDRQTLLNKVWGDNIYVVDRTVDVHVRKIREKLGDHYIETVKGVGYRFKE